MTWKHFSCHHWIIANIFMQVNPIIPCRKLFTSGTPPGYAPIVVKKQTGIRLMQRAHGRSANQLRPVTLTRHFAKHAEGSCLIEIGDTKVLCTASIEERQPPWLRGQNKGWVTAEYGMLPRATHERGARESTNKGGRTSEIQRLVGRAMRSVVDLKTLGKRTIWIDCDVLQADGGTRTAAITAGFVALMDACRLLTNQRLIPELPIQGFVAAISCGLVDSTPVLDMDYAEDARCAVDGNFIMNNRGAFIEIQCAGENNTFTRAQYDSLVVLAEQGIQKLIQLQQKALLTP
jgi:ribonuclease PH